VLDFGAVKRLPDGMPPEMGRLLTLALAGESQAVVDGLRELGFIKSSIKIDGDALLTYLDPFIEPIRHPQWRFERAWMRSLFAYVNDVRRPDWTMGLKLNLPPEYLLIHRVWLGGIAVLCQIDGDVPVPEVLEQWLPEFDASVIELG
jgi:hypothetical protein